MDRVEIISLREALPKVVPFLHDRGLLDVEEVPLDEAKIPGFLNRVELPEEEQQKAAHLDDLDRMLREIVPLLAGKPSPSDVARAVGHVESMPESEYYNKVRQWHRELRGLTRRKINAQDNLEILNNYRLLLQTLAPMLGPRKVTFGRDARAVVLQGDIQRTVTQLTDRMKAVVGPEVEFVRQSMGRNQLVGVLMYPEEKNESVGRVLREEGIVPVDTPDKDPGGSSLPTVLERVERQINEQNIALSEIRRELQRYTASHGADLLALARIVSDELSRYRVVNHFAESQMIAVMHGWMPSDEVAGFASALEKRFPGEVSLNALSAKGIAHDKIPTLLKNPRWLKPFEVLLAILRPPTYGTYDATLLVAVAFVLFYGFIVGDVFYGVCILGFAHWMRSKWGHNYYVDAAGKVGYWMAGSTIFWGLIFGEYMGNFGHNVLGLPVFFHRFEEMIPLLLIAIGIGVVHIYMSLILGIRESLRHHHTQHAQEKLGMLLGLSGLFVFVMNMAGLPVLGSKAFLVLAAILYLSGAVIILKAMGGMGMVNILEIFSLAGNVLSYARLMALGIASVIIADLANELPHGVGYLVGVPLAIAIHLFNIALAMFSPTLHSLRLNYVEFLPKFYTPEGRSYKPFRKEALW